MDELARELREIVGEVRARVGAGREPGVEGAEIRIRAAAERARADGPNASVTKAEKRALEQVARVVAVHRARSLIAREPAPPPPPVTVNRRAQLRTRPTITGNMEVGRARTDDALTLTWKADARVTAWEVRLSELSGRTYEVRDTRELDAGASSVDVPLTDTPLRVHLLGRRRDGKLLHRAIVSGLTNESWDERWERRASAS